MLGRLLTQYISRVGKRTIITVEAHRRIALVEPVVASRACEQNPSKTLHSSFSIPAALLSI